MKNTDVQKLPLPEIENDVQVLVDYVLELYDNDVVQHEPTVDIVITRLLTWLDRLPKD